MATMPELADGTLITSAQWNAHAKQINENTATIADHNASLIGHESRLDVLEEIANSVLLRRYATANQVLPSHTWAKMTVPNVRSTTPKITPNGANDTFTVTKSGVYLITASARFEANETGSRHLVISSGSTVDERWGGNSVPGGLGFFTPGATTARYLTAGSTISVYVFQDSGVNLSLMPSGEVNHVSITYIGAS